MAFHPDGERLASVGLDDDHSVAVWKVSHTYKEPRNRTTIPVPFLIPVCVLLFQLQDTGGSWSRIVREATGKGDRNAVFFLEWALDHEDPIVNGKPAAPSSTASSAGAVGAKVAAAAKKPAADEVRAQFRNFCRNCLLLCLSSDIYM